MLVWVYESQPTVLETCNTNSFQLSFGLGYVVARVELDSINRISVKELLNGVFAGTISETEIIAATLNRIAELDEIGPELRAVISRMDDTSHDRVPAIKRGPLLGLPVLVKDNIDTANYPTTAGSLALEGSKPQRNAPVVQALLDLGATVVGKTNLSEWSNFRGVNSISGWSGIGGQTRNPYVLDRSPGGSSSGSAVAVAAGYVPVALGTETDGSIICPAALNGVVGFKPTVGILPTTGVIPISSTQDTVGLFARFVPDIAFVFGELVRALGRSHLFGGDFAMAFERRSRRTTGVRIGIPRIGFTGYSVKLDKVFENAIEALGASGAIIIDEIDTRFNVNFSYGIDDEVFVFHWEMYKELNRYLAERQVEGISSIQDLIEFNERNAKLEMQYFGQEHFEIACEVGIEQHDKYFQRRMRNLNCTETSILTALTLAQADVLCVPSMSPAWTIDRVNGDSIAGSGYSVAAIAGVCSLNVPMGLVDGLPVGMTLFASHHQDAKLLAIGTQIERVLSLNLTPGFHETI